MRGQKRVKRGEEAKYADRPERFYKALEGEEEATKSARVISGGSQTTANIEQDALNTMLNADTLHTLKDVAKGSKSISDLLMRGGEYLLQHAFGQSADIAAAGARKLASTDPRVHAEAMREFKMRLGRGRAQILDEMMQRQRRAVRHAVAGTAGAVPGEKQ